MKGAETLPAETGRLAVISDLHANRHALAEFRELLAAEPVDWILNAGDFVGMGAWPRETCEWVLTEPRVRSVRGNHEFQIVGRHADEASPRERAHFQWQRTHAGEEWCTRLAQVPTQRDLIYRGLQIRLAHADARVAGTQPWSIPVPPTRPPGEGLNEEGADASAPPARRLFVLGHTHLALFRQERTHAVLNPGALGVPATGGYTCAVLNVTPGGHLERVQVLRLPVKTSAVVADMRARAVPDFEFLTRTFFHAY